VRAPAWGLVLSLATLVVGVSQAQGGPAIRRVANMPDGAPAFGLVDARGQRAGRIECVFNGWYDSDTMAARLMGAREVMAAVLSKPGRLAIDDLGPAKFDCMPVAQRTP
jgi:hypothetical protein